MKEEGLMPSSLSRPITEEEIATFEEEGVVCLRGLFDGPVVERLRGLIDQDIEAPSRMRKEVNEKGGTGDFFADTFVCHHLPGFRDVIDNAPMAEIAGTLMRASKINLLFDQILVKEPGTSTRTVWHHDATYWPVAGQAIATLWIALDEATAETGAMEFVAGSHRWGQRFKAVSFDPKQTYVEDLPTVPDIEAERDRHPIISYDLEPGDCTLHHGLLLHAAPGNANQQRRRRAYLTRWAGDGVTYNPRPNLQQMLRDPGIPPGAPLDSDLFPVIWRRDGISTASV